MPHQTREEWLQALASSSASIVTRSIADGGDEDPALRLSCGFPPAQGKRTNAQAAVLPPTASEDFTAEIFVSPEIDSPAEVARLVLPLLVAAHSGDYKHGARWRNAVAQLGLQGDNLPDWLTRRLNDLGSYPHAQVTVPARTKQTTRLVRVICESDRHESAYIARVSRTTLEAYGAPICPACSNAMEVR